ncbi:MAG: helix-turn-helix transcriptional regulator [Proteobacteria bacterium]|nr:helix-turn-helix transcriptional regulator [Pseudomonadota bacterium]
MPSPKPASSTYGRRLRAARLAAGLSLGDMSEALGHDDYSTGAPQVSRYERGEQSPRPRIAETIAGYLGLPLAYFYAEDDKLAELILLYSRMPARKQNELLKQLREQS